MSTTSTYTIPLSDIIKEYSLDVIHLPKKAEEIAISTREVNRPGLPLAGFFDHFEKARIEVIGKVEHLYLAQLSDEERAASISRFFEHKPVAIVISTALPVFEEMKTLAATYEIPLLRTAQKTSDFIAALISYLNVALAPRITRHGVLVDIYGEGILLLGDSGIGKSETAIELLKRGHRLIADDAVEIKRVSSKTLVGSAPEIIRHFVELRGIGIVDIRRVFGMGAIKLSEKVDLIVKLEHWDKNKVYDRIGTDVETTNILGLDITTNTIPIRPGRNIAVILEIAAMNNRQKRMGYNTAEEFNKRIMEQMMAPKDDDDE